MELDWLYHGDCITGLQALETGSVDLVFADPPFNIGYNYDTYNDRRQAEQYLDWTRAWGEAVWRVLKPAGTFWLAIGDEYAAELKLIFEKELGLTCRSWVIWYYTFGVNCTRKFSRSHTHLFHFVNGERVQQTSLHEGDLLRIGGFTFAIEAEDNFQTTPDAHAAQGMLKIADILPRPGQEVSPQRKAS